MTTREQELDQVLLNLVGTIALGRFAGKSGAALVDAVEEHLPELCRLRGEVWLEAQAWTLEAVAQRHGWAMVGVFADEGIGGRHGREKRPAFDKVLQGVARREYDVVAAWSVDGLGRSLRHLLDFLGELKAKGVDLYLHQQGVDTGTPAGDALYQMLGVFAEFERAIIVQRVHAGLARARALGRRLGRPLRLIDTGLARRLLSEGESLRQVALALEVPASTLSSRLSKKP